MRDQQQEIDDLKERVRKLEEIEEFEQKHAMSFEEFKEKWENGEIEGKYSYDVESDFWEWGVWLPGSRGFRKGLRRLADIYGC
ncbi:MAG: hypothetical protein ABEJ56_00175 [Candidatus Nanohaloarchaea archaeon]